jgi:predicted O-methyltransferase YrrM
MKLPAHLRRLANLPKRAVIAGSYGVFNPLVLGSWLVRSREDTNFTYALTELNKVHLMHMISVVTGAPVTEIREYLNEILEDEELKRHIRKTTTGSDHEYRSDPFARFGRRIGWYATVRATKPKTVIETGVEKGLGSVVLCAALLRNAEVGAPGHYYGFDLDPGAGWLLQGKYAEVGTIITGDSCTSLAKFEKTIDVMVTDSAHTENYELAEYRVVSPRLSPKAILISDDAHVHDCLGEFARETGRHYLFFAERPKDHWYPGGGIGFAFAR